MGSPLTFVRPRIGLRREKTWTLDDTKLAWATTTETGETPLSKITGIKMRYTPSPQAGLPATRECVISIAGQKRQSVVTQEYSMQAHEPARAAYAAFVRDLMHRTVAKNPSVVLSSGDLWIQIMWICMFLFAAAGTLFFGYHLVTDEFDFRIAIVVLLFAMFAYPLWGQMRVSGKTTFDLAHIPAEIVG